MSVLHSDATNVISTGNLVAKCPLPFIRRVWETKSSIPLSVKETAGGKEGFSEPDVEDRVKEEMPNARKGGNILAEAMWMEKFKGVCLRRIMSLPLTPKDSSSSDSWQRCIT
jgi:hypothetical protein